MQHMKAGKVDVSHDPRRRSLRLPVSAYQGHERRAACRPRWMKLGTLPRRSSNVCIFTARFGGTEVRPRKDRQAQSDGRRVQGVDGVG